MPSSPMEFIDFNKIGHGAMFKGAKGFLIADFQNRVLLPYGAGADITYYNRRPAEKTPSLYERFPARVDRRL